MTCHTGVDDDSSADGEASRRTEGWSLGFYEKHMFLELVIVNY